MKTHRPILNAIILLALALSPCTAQSAEQPADEPRGRETSQLETLRAENARLREASRDLEIEKLKQDNQHLIESRDRLLAEKSTTNGTTSKQPARFKTLRKALKVTGD